MLLDQLIKNGHQITTGFLHLHVVLGGQNAIDVEPHLVLEIRSGNDSAVGDTCGTWPHLGGCSDTSYSMEWAPQRHFLRLSRRRHFPRLNHPTSMSLPNAQAVICLHDDGLVPPAGPVSEARSPAGAVWYWIAVNHRHNRLLWAEEDLARRTQVSDNDIAANKRHIDGFNQARNDATERIDECLLTTLGLVDEISARTDAPVSLAPAGARLSSETAGSMIDRMSILALKIQAMRQQTERDDVDEAHRDRSRVKLARLRQQREDLGSCLDSLLAESAAGRAYFKVYRQFKMYNDARFNPALVAEGRDGSL